MVIFSIFLTVNKSQNASLLPAQPVRTQVKQLNGLDLIRILPDSFYNLEVVYYLKMFVFYAASLSSSLSYHDVICLYCLFLSASIETLDPIMSPLQYPNAEDIM